MYGESFIGEKFVSHIWDGGHFAKNALRAKDGRKIEVIYQGLWNDDAGADFRDAEIRIDGQAQKGDVEIHVKSSYWRMHHHDINPRYNSTILHVVMWDDGSSLLVRKQNGERIPTLILYDYLDSSIGKLWKAIEEGEEKPFPCRKKTEMMTPEAIGIILDRAGMERFLHKAKAFGKNLHENDKDQLLYSGIMEALGYSKNKEQFLDLARRVPLESMVGRSPEEIQAALFGVAGLLPLQGAERARFDEETEEYISKIEARWKLFSPRFNDGPMSGEQWKFFRLRPENYPTKRIAGMSYILSNCGNGNPSASLLTVFASALGEASRTPRKLRDILMPRASGYWTRHYTFGGKKHKENPFVIGRSRAADIVINVILPVVLAYARQSGYKKLQQAVTVAYADHRKLQENNITRYVASRIFRDRKEQKSVINSVMRQQGLIHLYKNFCFTRNCQDCLLTEKNI